MMKKLFFLGRHACLSEESFALKKKLLYLGRGQVLLEETFVFRKKTSSSGESMASARGPGTRMSRLAPYLRSLCFVTTEL
mgnify:CR=1 FL=1